MPGPDDKADPNATTAHDRRKGEGDKGGEKRSASGRPGGAASLVGLVLSDRYRIEKLLGEGGMGAVYQAEHTHMRKRMAIKVLHAEMSRLPEVVARFEREAMAAAHIDHPNVASATDFGKLEDGSFFLALEFVEGESLRDVLAGAHLSVARSLHIAKQIAAGLSRAHTLGIVHRDLKPENVMLVERDGDPDFVKVLDFGIAKVPVGEFSQTGPDGSPKILTQAGMVYGTPEYMAPEQALGQPVDQRADLYALGIMIYEMLTSRRPFDDGSKVKLLGMHVTAPVPPMSEVAPDAHIPAEVEDLVLRLLAKESSERFQDAKEFIEALQATATLLVQAGHIDSADAAKLLPAPSAVTSTPGLLTPAPLKVLTPASERLAITKKGLSNPLADGERRKKRTIMIVGASLALLFVATGLGIGLRGSSNTGTTPQGSATPSTSVVATARPSAAPSASADLGSVDDRIAAALAMLKRGDYASGIERLHGINREAAGRADVHEALLAAYTATKKPQEAMTEAEALLKLRPTAAKDLKLRVPVRDAAIGTDPGAADIAFRLLESAMGQTGLDDTYDIAYGRSGEHYPDAAKRAQKVLARPEVRARMSPALLITLDVQSAGQTCAVKKLLERAAADGDANTLELLKSYKPGPKVQGAKKDPLQCLRDDALGKAIKALEARLSK